MGQACVLQLCAFVSDPQPTPPLVAEVTTVRDCVCVPDPHVSEHAPKEPQVLRTQSTGQACVLQDCVLVSVGHPTPPLAAPVVIVRAWVCTPVPHVSEQAPNEPQPLTTQLTGHAESVQVDDSVVDPEQ
jgi:hypothetical protein